MRLWTLHPHYLDSKGLVALWREALLAQKVLAGGTRGYQHHPQLQRFRAAPQPSLAIAAYLHGVLGEAVARGYRFDATKIGERYRPLKLEATTGQLHAEWGHLLAKLEHRAPQLAQRHQSLREPLPHPIFHIEPGPVADWEKSGAQS